ncbi:hypothetical protein NN561_006713 [Cricetulus griseus]
MQRGRRLEGELELGEQRCCLSRSCERGAASKAKDTGAVELPGPPKPSPRQGSRPRPAQALAPCLGAGAEQRAPGGPARGWLVSHTIPEDTPESCATNIPLNAFLCLQELLGSRDQPKGKAVGSS